MKPLAFDRFLSRRRFATALVTLLVVVAALSLAAGPVAAAGSTTTTTHSSSSPGTPSSSYRKALAAFESCLAKHGVKLPTFNGTRPSGSFPRPSGSTPPSGSNEGGFRPGGFFGGGSTNSKSAKAYAACKSKLPAGSRGFGAFGGFGGGSSHPSAAQQAALSNYEKCMTAHGVTIASNTTFQQIQSLIRSDPSASKANQSCLQDLRAAFTPPSGSHPPIGSSSSGSASA
ncbi:MAG TPA: hypothetical protein VK277_06490 [Acidimicrobiales bacterium]|nr:hypothetical protein [Acidimicrobiales bacterium]